MAAYSCESCRTEYVDIGFAARANQRLQSAVQFLDVLLVSIASELTGSLCLRM